MTHQSDEYRPSPSSPADHIGSDAAGTWVAPAVQRASTVLFRDLDAFEAAAASRFDAPYYGRYGTTTTFALEDAVAQLEGADKTYAVASGHAAITAAMLAFLSPGDHILIPEGAYEPTKHLATGLLRQYGIDVDFYPGRTGAEIASYCRPTTRLIWIEAPGSLTYEIPEITDVVRCAQEKAIITIADNTWASSCLFSPLRAGIDVSVVSATKYMSGHADVIGGFISVNAKRRRAIEAALVALGPALSPDAAYLIWRGLQTMHIRLRHQAEAAAAIATALLSDDRLDEIFHPALPSSPDHGRWRKYFTGSNGLLSFTLARASRADMSAFISELQLIRLGVSWGGFESLIFPKAMAATAAGHQETPVPWLVRLSVGLGGPQHVLADLDRALTRLTDRICDL
jgi:cystathionine beta-lyase